ncbi:hypothetical protein C7974DRAFT_396230 [Boeremia exigua]|uniref:uncharacterized protein n=1 Tax=Boeremia exigua TaxID=749465 RepID=UPI001E8D548A|nr:uncharacterized protein C7974DRAFT_396230 [Boeremia exigua]KAH6625531.1 hypothetical protein C7974DRAFT_396230 [Boeremia exigua]
MSRNQQDPYWIDTDEREHQEQGLLYREFEMQREPSPLNTPVTAQRTRPDDAPTTSSLQGEKSSRTIPGWPSSPKPINTPIYVQVLNAIFDIILLAGSTAFFAFAIVVGVHDQVPTADYPRLTTTLIGATKYGPTVFPILFASIVGRAAHAVLLWRLEKGGRIGTLDTLASSTSLTSTVTSQLQLRSFSTLSVALLAVWMFSPIGGQASVRMMTIGSKDTKIDDSAWYMVNHGYLGSYSSGETDLQGNAMAGVVFVAALMGSPATKSSPLDVWGNVKVPRIEGYEQAVAMDHDGWYETKDGDSDAYSSLVGIPILGMNQSNFIDYSMRIHSPYFGLDCSINTTVSEMDSILVKTLPGLSSNATSPGSMLFWDIPEFSILANMSRESWRDRASPETISPLKIKYVPLYRSNFTLTCDVTQSYVETEIRCPTHSTCAAKRVRRSRLNQFPAAWTLLDISSRTPKHLFQGILKPFAGGKLRYPQLFDRYLADPNLINSNYANVSQTTEEKYTIRLGQMLNAYFSCLNGFFAITAGINNDTAYFWDNNQTFELPPNVNGSWQNLYHSTVSNNMLNDMFETKSWTSAVTKTERKEVIIAHRIWIIALCLASIILIVSSLIAPFIRSFLATGVDVAMNISSLATRNNPHMSLPQTGTFLDASDRAGLLFNHQVRFGDANSSEDVGSLVIGSFDRAGDSGIARVRKRRLYN